MNLNDPNVPANEHQLNGTNGIVYIIPADNVSFLFTSFYNEVFETKHNIHSKLKHDFCAAKNKKANHRKTEDEKRKNEWNFRNKSQCTVFRTTRFEWEG